MPNIKSAVKRMHQSEENRLANRRYRSAMRTEIKKFRQLILEGKLEAARELLPQVYTVIDKTSQKGIIHPNKAARFKSRLTKRLQAQAS